MDSSVPTRVKLNLESFFQDHRKGVLVSVKTFQIIAELHARITKLLGIKNFHLFSDGHFLPLKEPISILEKDETICVVPIKNACRKNGSFPKEKNTPMEVCKVINQAVKRSFADPDKGSLKKNKKKKHHNRPLSPSTTGSENSESKSKTYLESGKGIVASEISKLELAKKIQESDKNLKQKTDKNNETNANQTPVKSSIKETTSYAGIRLSRQTEPATSFVKYTPPLTNTEEYLAKNKINIVRIDVVKASPTQINNTPNVNRNINLNNTAKDCLISDSSSPPEHYVKNLVSALEKNISPVGDQSKQSIENNVLVELLNKSEKQQGSSSKDNHVEQIIPEVETESQDNQTTQKKIDNINVLSSMEGTEKAAQQPDETIKEDDTAKVDNDLFSSVSQRAKLSKAVSTHAGLGLCLNNLRGTDALASEAQESDVSSINEVKRKRIRKHRQRNTKKPEPATNKVNNVPYTPKPMLSKACPKLHIKFEDSSTDIPNMPEVTQDLNNKEQNFCSQIVQNTFELPEDNNFFPTWYVDKTESSEEKEIVKEEERRLFDERNNLLMEGERLFKEEDIAMAPLMKDDLKPRVGDVIAFKILKLAADYTPQISHQIIGKVEIHNEEANKVFFKIIYGKGELATPTGKLSMDLEGKNHSDDLKGFLWSELIEAKLLYP